MSTPPIAPTITPTNEPVARLDFEFEADATPVEAIEVGGRVVVRTVVPVGGR